MKFNRFISFTELKYLGLKKGGGGDTPKPEFKDGSTLDFTNGGGQFKEGNVLECTVGHFTGSTLDLT